MMWSGKKWMSLFLALSFAIPLSEAQILNRLKRKLEKKIEQKAEEEIDKELSKKVDEELGQDTSMRKSDRFGGYDRTEAALLEGMMGSKLNVADVELPATYDFELEITYEIQTEGEEPLLMSYMIAGEDAGYMGFEMKYEDRKALQKMVWDLERDVFVSYSEDEEGNRSLNKLPNFLTLADQQSGGEAGPEMTIEKTGKTKEILGYQCEEYLIDSEEYESRVWIAPNFPYSYEEFARLIGQQMRVPEYSKLSDTKGYALEMISTEKKKKGKTTRMTVIELKDETFQIVNADYLDDE